MKLNVMYAVGNHYHITGNEPVYHTVMTNEEFQEFRNRPEIIELNTWKYEEQTEQH